MPRRTKAQIAIEDEGKVKPRRLGKQEVMDLWDRQEEDGPIGFRPISNLNQGSSYINDSIRITGSQEAINWVLGRLKPLLELDSGGSRLEILYTETVERVKDATGKLVPGGLTGSWACYLKARERGTTRPKGRRKAVSNGDSTVEKNPLREVNAGLKLKAKPKETKPSEPVYALGTPDPEDPEQWLWIEPAADEDMPMDTYPDFDQASSAYNTFRKNKNFKGQKIYILEVTDLGNGNLKFENMGGDKD